jgi:uncharacterized protein GlcG (DUF336 family)
MKFLFAGFISMALHLYLLRLRRIDNWTSSLGNDKKVISNGAIMAKILLFLLITLALNVYGLNKPVELNLETAQKIANKAEACGKKNNWKLSVSIVNSEGNLLYFQRGDGSYSGSIEASIDKAKSANAFQRPTKAFVEGLKEGRIGLMTVKDIVGIEGGLPIQFGEKHVGAIGVSGAKSSEDEQCAKAALE